MPSSTVVQKQKRKYFYICMMTILTLSPVCQLSSLETISVSSVAEAMTIKKIINATTYAIAVAKFMTQAKKTGSNVIDAVDSF